MKRGHGVLRKVNITITGKQMDVGEALRDYMHQHLIHVTTKYFESPLEGSAHFYWEGHRFGCELSVHVGHHIHCESHAQARDPYDCANKALHRLEKQLRRNKRKRRDHHRKEQSRFRWTQLLAPWRRD